MYAATTDHTIQSYDHKQATKGHYANNPVIAFCNIDYPSLEKLSRMLEQKKKKKVEEKRLTHNTFNFSCGFVKTQRLQGKKKGDATPWYSTNVLSQAVT